MLERGCLRHTWSAALTSRGALLVGGLVVLVVSSPGSLALAYEAAALVLPLALSLAGQVLAGLLDALAHGALAAAVAVGVDEVLGRLLEALGGVLSLLAQGGPLAGAAVPVAGGGVAGQPLVAACMQQQA